MRARQRLDRVPFGGVVIHDVGILRFDDFPDCELVGSVVDLKRQLSTGASHAEALCQRARHRGPRSHSTGDRYHR